MMQKGLESAVQTAVDSALGRLKQQLSREQKSKESLVAAEVSELKRQLSDVVNHIGCYFHRALNGPFLFIGG
jgi:hypothetical protein